MEIAVMLCQTKAYVYLIIQEIGFVLHNLASSIKNINR